MLSRSLAHRFESIPHKMIDELKTYVSFTEADAKLLLEARPMLSRYFDAIVDQFYEAISLNEQARTVFRDDAQIERQKAFLNGWLDSLFGGRYDASYFESRARIGRVHTEVTLPQRYLFTSMNLIRTSLHAAVHEQQDWSESKKIALHIAISKICDIDLAIILESFSKNSLAHSLDEKSESIETAISANTRLTATLAHEIRNPLNSAQLQLELLRRSLEDLNDQMLVRSLLDRADVIKEEIDRLSQLLDDFLSFTRPGTQGSPESFDLVDIVQEVVALEEPLATKTHTQLSFTANERLIVQGSKPRIKQIVLNVLKNAIEAVSDSEDAKVSISVTVQNQEALVSVIDNGPGLTQEVITNAFRPFFTTKDSGTGLGLNIAQRIALAHGGKITLGNHPTLGAQVDIFLPLDCAKNTN